MYKMYSIHTHTHVLQGKFFSSDVETAVELARSNI